MSPASRGIAVMIASTICFSAMHVAIRLVGKELHPFQIAFVRNVLGLLLLLPIFLHYGIGLLATKRPWLHAVRAVFNIVAMLSFFTALTITPIAHVTALGFTAPIFAAVLGVIFLGERIRWRRSLAIATGFLGAMIVLQPGAAGLDAGSMLVLFSALVWAVTMLLIRMLGTTESSLVITAYMSLSLAVLSLLPGVWVWRWPSTEASLLLVVIAVTGTLAQWLLAEALKQAEAGVVMPFDFLKLLWASAAGYLVFAEAPGAATWIGGLVIAASAAYIAIREARERRGAASVAPDSQ